MCNAWNHPAGCPCGFGGDTGGGGWSNPSSWPSLVGYHTWAYRHEDFTRPTYCPRCGAAVFFVLYNGGNVWFDELGPPWDKHPCFDDDPSGASIRTALRAAPRGTLLGVVLETFRTSPTHSGRVLVRCSDGMERTDDHAATNIRIGQVVEVRRAGRGITLVPIGSIETSATDHLQLLRESAQQFARHIVCPRCGQRYRPENACRLTSNGAVCVHCTKCGLEFPEPQHG